MTYVNSPNHINHAIDQLLFLRSNVCVFEENVQTTQENLTFTDLIRGQKGSTHAE